MVCGMARTAAIRHSSSSRNLIWTRLSFVTTTLAQSRRFAFNAATAHRRDSGGSSSVISRTLSLGIAQTKRRMP